MALFAKNRNKYFTMSNTIEHNQKSSQRKWHVLGTAKRSSKFEPRKQSCPNGNMVQTSNREIFSLLSSMDSVRWFNTWGMAGLVKFKKRNRTYWILERFSFSEVGIGLVLARKDTSQMFHLAGFRVRKIFVTQKKIQTERKHFPGRT